MSSKGGGGATEPSVGGALGMVVTVGAERGMRGGGWRGMEEDAGLAVEAAGRAAVGPAVATELGVSLKPAPFHR